MEIGDYWRNRGISVALCGQVLAAIELLELGVLHVLNLKRSGPTDPRQALCDGAFGHGWVQEFSHPGLGGQHETNVRFAPEHGPFFDGAHQLAERLWEVGADYSQDLLEHGACFNC